jgi:exodeoxyribonuclease VII small subunit
MKARSKAKSNDDHELISYQEAMDELESILSEIESGEIDVDLLSEKVKRALYLITYCKGKLRKTDDEVRKLLSGFEKPDADSDEADD